MILELHIIQNFAPANLNRDDTGSPKDCEFGGFRRARISSQCLKRAIRTEFAGMPDLLQPSALAVRTKRIVEELSTRLESSGKPVEEARIVVEAALGAVGLSVENDGKTQYLLYLGSKEVQAILSLCLEHWDVLLQTAKGPQNSSDKAKKPGKDQKKAAKDAVPAEVKNALKSALDGGRAADLALFGRMLADLPEKNTDAACQVAHAISTNRVSMEFDYYTAVDDLKPDDTQGADMLGTVEFNSSCFYRYANIDITELRKNLSGDAELTVAALRAFLRASIQAIPTGKQNSMAAHNPPSFVMAVVRNAGCWSLANAFLKPVRPTQECDMVQQSIAAIDFYWGKLTGMYGEPAGGKVFVATTEPDSISKINASVSCGVDCLIDAAVAAVEA